MIEFEPLFLNNFLIYLWRILKKYDMSHAWTEILSLWYSGGKSISRDIEPFQVNEKKTINLAISVINGAWSLYRASYNVNRNTNLYYFAFI